MKILKDARLGSGVSQKHMASQLGVTCATLERMEENILNAKLRDILTVYDNVNMEGRQLISDNVVSFFNSETKQNVKDR